ncbi:MAG: transcription factor FapR [Firmicutes bacterium]|nr:transcription factor FapR [Bacillota bacterium]
MRQSKQQRQQRLSEMLEEDPFLTDERLAQALGVSVQTVRLDRIELGVPELRERVKNVARAAYGRVRSMEAGEVVGELIDLVPDQSGLSIMEVTPEMVFQKTSFARGHHIFAQANSLAAAVVDVPVALTASAQIRFLRPVKVGERLVAKAQVRNTEGDFSEVEVVTRVGREKVFEGLFQVFRARREHGRKEGGV